MRKPRNYNVGVLIEGSSTAYGYGDESLGLGYASRIAKHLDAYNERSKRRIPRWVYTFLNAQPDRMLPQVVADLPQNITVARRTVGAGNLVGIFAVGGRLDYLAADIGKKNAMTQWSRSLRDLDTICLDYAVKPIVIGAPVLPLHIPLNDGSMVDQSMLEWSVNTTREFVKEDMEAPYIPFEKVMGDDLTSCMAEDQKHANSLGYDRIVGCLLPYIHTLLELDKTLDLQNC